MPIFDQKKYAKYIMHGQVKILRNANHSIDQSRGNRPSDNISDYKITILRDLKDKDMDTKAKFPIFHVTFFMMDFLAVIISITLLFLFAICNVPSSPPYVQEDFEALRTGVDFGIVAAALSFTSTASIMIKSIVDLRRAWKKKKVVTAKGSFRV